MSDPGTSDRTDPSPTDGEGTDTAIVWLPFTGTAERLGTTFRLTARNRNGSIELGENDVGFSTDGEVHVRKGAVVSHVDEPWHSDTSARPPRTSLGSDCPDGVTCCVGSVLICCADFRVIGAGSGQWGCERPGFIP